MNYFDAQHERDVIRILDTVAYLRDAPAVLARLREHEEEIPAALDALELRGNVREAVEVFIRPAGWALNESFWF